MSLLTSTRNALFNSRFAESVFYHPSSGKPYCIDAVVNRQPTDVGTFMVSVKNDADAGVLTDQLTLVDDVLELQTDVNNDDRVFWLIHRVLSQDVGVIELETAIRRTINTNRKSPSVTNGRTDGGYASNLSSVNCHVRHLGGGESQIAGAMRTVNQFEFVVNASKDIIPTDQIVYTDQDSVSRKFNVLSVVNSVETDELKIITATETRGVV